MSVTLIVSETIAGAEVSDALAGGSTGVDYGQVVNGQYTPIISQAGNTGYQDLYMSHNATVDPITSVKFFVQTYSGTYGGAASAAADIATLLALGAANSGNDRMNTDGLSRGLHMDMDWQTTASTQFDPSRETSGQKRIFGKTYSGSLDGSSLSKAFGLNVAGSSYYNGSSEVAASSPVAGKIGKSTDTVLGNRGHVKTRFYLNTAAVDGGILQWDTVVAYSYTA